VSGECTNKIKESKNRRIEVWDWFSVKGKWNRVIVVDFTCWFGWMHQDEIMNTSLLLTNARPSSFRVAANSAVVVLHIFLRIQRKRRFRKRRLSSGERWTCTLFRDTTHNELSLIAYARLVSRWIFNKLGFHLHFLQIYIVVWRMKLQQERLEKSQEL
jgi:hypothetical protein